MKFANLVEISSLPVEIICIPCRVEFSFTFVSSTSTKLNKFSVLSCLLLNTFTLLRRDDGVKSRLCGALIRTVYVCLLFSRKC